MARQGVTERIAGASAISNRTLSPHARRRTASKPLITVLGFATSGFKGLAAGKGEELLVQVLAALGRALHAFHDPDLLFVPHTSHDEVEAIDRDG